MRSADHQIQSNVADHEHTGDTHIHACTYTLTLVCDARVLCCPLSGPVVVTIASTDGGFKSQGCGTWTQVPAPQAGGTSGATSFADGTWRVGVDIQPGTYRTDGQDKCYYAVLSGFGGGDNDIVNNDNPSGPVTLTLDSSVLGIKSQGCGTWTKTS